MQIRIKGARVIDPGRIDEITDVLVVDGKIAGLGSEGPSEHDGDPATVIDATGKILTPGLIDMHVHFREPGHEYKETIETGCRAAAAGGFTTVCTMPNTLPVNDNRQITEFILEKAARSVGSRVLPVGAISKGIAGQALADFGDLKASGAIAVTDDGHPVTNSLLMRNALEYAKGFGLLVISHCEDLQLSHRGAMNEGELATRMGLVGIPNAAESSMVLRDIALCELTKTPLHIAHVSTAQSVRAIENAKTRGLPVTAETAPHYFTLTETAVTGYNTNAKMNPPLRSHEDREAVREALARGIIDVIATDHAPHTSIEKDVEFDQAVNGIIGLETSLPLGLKLVEDGVLTIEQLIESMAVKPALVLGIDNRIRVGNRADLTLIDLNLPFVVDVNRFCSQSRNSPFDGWQLKGRAVMTMVCGRVVFNEL
ncbi:MAG: dihydroorotase [Deltaproteobacteria bacterium]|nr:dihydroorotase [Deltaproteobacteria bacterium]